MTANGRQTRRARAGEATSDGVALAVDARVGRAEVDEGLAIRATEAVGALADERGAGRESIFDDACGASGARVGRAGVGGEVAERSRRPGNHARGAVEAGRAASHVLESTSKAREALGGASNGLVLASGAEVAGGRAENVGEGAREAPVAGGSAWQERKNKKEHKKQANQIETK